MERLTEKVNDYWKTTDKAHIYYLDTNESVFVGNAIDRLAEFEDLMDELGFDDVQQLKLALTTSEIWEENQVLKDRWDKLKDWVNEFHRDVVAVYPKTLLDKMKELEIKE